MLEHRCPSSPSPVDRLPSCDEVIGVQEIPRAVTSVEEPSHQVDTHNGKDVENKGGNEEDFTAGYREGELQTGRKMQILVNHSHLMAGMDLTSDMTTARIPSILVASRKGRSALSR